ncbi:MAG: histone deacetylase [Planctomycetota bacterium]
MGKFALLRDVLLDEGVAEPGDFVTPEPASRAAIHRVHDRGYVGAFVAGALDRDAVRRIGLPWSEGLVRRTITAVGGTMRTAELALEHGLAANCAGGTHHAHADYGSGFCILNDLAVAAQHLLDHFGVSQVLVIDLDVHQGDGTARVFRDEPRVFTFSMHCGKNFPSRKAESDLDVELPKGFGDAAYLEVLERGCSSEAGMQDDTHAHSLGSRFVGLAALLERVEPDVVLYDAGVDVHRDDALGHLCLTDRGLLARDRYVIETCRSQGVPVACVIGGGYDKDWRRLASRHASVHRAARDYVRDATAMATGKPAEDRPTVRASR